MPLPTAQKMKTEGLTLKGSAVVVKDYLSFAINSVLFQRDVFRPDEFEMSNKYGLPLMMLKDKHHLKSILNDAEKAMSSKGLRRVILALFKKRSDVVIEKWEFDVMNENVNTNNNVEIGSKSHTIIQNEIRCVLKQVLGSVSFLPMIEAGAEFKILFVFELGFSLPGWTTYRGSLAVNDSEEFVFKDFSTSLHKCNTKVTYRRQ